MRSAENTAPEIIPVEELDQKIFNCATQIDALIYEMLVLIREFDRRGCYLKYGLARTSEWLEYRCDYSYSAAREMVRVAHAISELPLTTAALASGRLSYTKARAMTRVAHPGNEEKLLEFALRRSSRDVTEYCRQLRFGQPDSTGVAASAHARRSLHLRRDHERNMARITLELPLDVAELLEKALDKARDDECLKIPDLVDTSWSTRQADAFTNMVNEYLAGAAGDDAESHLVTIHVDQAALGGREGRSALPIETVKRLCCDGKAVVLTENEQGEPLSIGRKSRIVPKGIERAVRDRDNHACTFPGWRNRRFLHIHHVEHLSNDGETSLDNLKLLCTKHHTLLHEGGFAMRKNFRDEWVFVRPDGIEVPKYGYRPEDMIEEDRFAPGEKTFAPEINSTRVELLSMLEKIVREPPPPRYWCQPGTRLLSDLPQIGNRAAPASPYFI